MLIFEQREIPDGNLSDCLRQSIRNYAAPRGDEGDFHPLDWVQRLVQAHPETAPRVAAAYFELLGDADAGVICDVLEQVPSHPADLAPQLMEFMCRQAERLRARDDVYRTDRTLLGACVTTLYDTLNCRRGPTLEAARLLATLDRPEDGWPRSFLLALAADSQAQLPRLIAAIGRMNDEQLGDFLASMVNYRERMDDAFDAIGKGPPEIRLRAGREVRKFLHQVAASPSVNAAGRLAFEQRWQGYARRLGVAADLSAIR